MPFKVRFSIYEPGKLAPCSVTYDRKLAHAQYNELLRKGKALSRLVPEVIPEDLTRPEAYVWLVYRAIRAIRKYYDERGHVSKQQSDDNLHVSLALESELDKWIQRTRAYIDSHAYSFQPPTASSSAATVPAGSPAGNDRQRDYSFFLLVERWRNIWHQYFSYKKQRDKDPAVEKEMRNQCFAYEREINKYVTNTIGL